MNHSKTITSKNVLLRLIVFALLLLSLAIFNTNQKCAAGVNWSTVTISGTANKDVFDWPLDKLDNSDVILIPERMGLQDATEVKNNTLPSGYVKQAISGNYTIPMTSVTGSNQISLRYTKNLYSGNTGKAPNLTLTFPAAAKALDGTEYDVKMNIDNIYYRMAANRVGGIPVVWGSDNMLKVGAFNYGSQSDGPHGMRYWITVRLYKAGTSTQIEDGKRMLWGFEDIDVGDRIIGDDDTYDEYDYYWAEHVEMLSGYDAKFYVSNGTHLGFVRGRDDTNSVHIYNWYGSAESGREDVLMLVNPREFRFIWQGSQCGTTMAAIAGILYEGISWVDTGNSFTTNKGYGYDNGATVTVRKNSEQVIFWHRINRIDAISGNGPYNDPERYYVQVQDGYPNTLARRWDSGGRKWVTCTSDAPCTYQSKPDNYKAEVYAPGQNGYSPGYFGNPTGNPLTVDLSPGQTKTVWQRLKFEVSNINNTLGAWAQTWKDSNKDQKMDSGGGTCDTDKDYPKNTMCLHLYRPPAFFYGRVGSEVAYDNAGTYVNHSNAPKDSSGGIKVTSSDGSFKIRFNGSVNRLAENTQHTYSSDKKAKDEAGGTATSKYYTYISKGSIDTANMIQNTRTPATNSASTAGLNYGGSHNVFGSNNVYTGKLRYDERLTICGVVKYYYEINYAIKDGHRMGYPGYDCVTVYREPKPCDSNEGYKYGMHSGQNLGRIGVINKTYEPNNEDFHYTPINPTVFQQAPGNTVDVTVYARPGDNVRFMYQICAGGAYAVAHNDALSEPNNRTTYNATGSLSDSNSKGYLFGKTVSTRDTSYTSGLRYNNSRSWSSNGDNFLSSEPAEKTLASPSHAHADPTTYDVNTYNTQSYSCDNYNSDLPGAIEAHYQIAGSVVTDDIDSKCHAYTKTGVSSDVGHTITQQLNWNHLVVTGSHTTASQVAGHQTKFSARANVKIPYNYIIEPTISAKTEGNKHVVYLDESVTFNSDLYVTPRVNTIFGEESTNNKYATITKKTQIKFNWYIKRGLNTIRSGTIRNESGVILNNTGLLQGTATASGATTEGGHRYANYTIHIDDNLAVGDKICADISVTPADSHDNYNVASVYGEKVSNLSTATPGLSENGTTTRTRTACYTVAKKPTMSVEGANAYAGGEKGFVTSRYSRNFATSTNSDNTNYLFGSWSEYGVYGKVKLASNLGMASGATFGYATKNNGTTLNATRSNATSYANGGQVAIRDDEARRHVCTFSTQTFVNDKCNEEGINQLGMQGIGREQAEEFRKRIYDRFISLSNENAVPESSYTDTSVCPANWQWKSTLTTDDKCMKIPNKNGVKKTYASIRGWMNRLKFDENGINRTHIQGDAYLGAGDTFLTVWGNHNFKNSQVYVDPDTGIEYPDRNFTRIIEVDDTLVLDADIKVGSYKKNSWGEEITDDDPTLENAGEVVQFILIAKNIKITSRVNRIDAILIADNIDTCAYDVPKSGITSTNNGVRNGRELSIGNISASTCNNAIHFRAPVIAKKIELKRTFGADNGTESIRRAEIFDLNPYTYLWSYGQMSRYSQAVTTYSRELAPRY